jgi:hypothetical protein
MTTEQMMLQFPITARAWHTAGTIFTGIAIPCDKSTVDGSTIRSEKVLRFSRKALRKGGISKAKVSSRFRGGDDNMIVAVGKPGSRERVEALRAQYEATLTMGEEISPFGWEG